MFTEFQAIHIGFARTEVAAFDRIVTGAVRSRRRSANSWPRDPPCAARSARDAANREIQARKLIRARPSCGRTRSGQTAPTTMTSYSAVAGSPAHFEGYLSQCSSMDRRDVAVDSIISVAPSHWGGSRETRSEHGDRNHGEPMHDHSNHTATRRCGGCCTDERLRAAHHANVQW